MEEAPRDLFTPLVSNDALMGPFLLVARLFTTGIFVFYTINEVVKNHQPSVLIYVAMVIQLLGIVLVTLGYKTRFVALMLAAFCIITTLLFRGTPGFSDSFMTHLTKDLAVGGLFLFMFAYGPGPLSLDRLQDPSLKPRSSGGTGLILLVGRILSTLPFIFAGTNKIVHTPQMQAYMVKHNSHVPTNLIYLAIVTQILAPALVLLGYKTRYGALALSGFCIIATVLFHNEFGNNAELEHFLLDFAMAGGFLFMFAYGPGPISLDARQGHFGRGN
jgi:putative oxidoreductase